MKTGRRFKFRLYVVGNAPNSLQAVANLNTLCRTHLPDQCDIEVVDVLREPRRALSDGVFMTPMLLTLEPLPPRRIVGTLSRPEQVLLALGREAVAA
jgi:circadian clock protein KaiB